MNLRTKVAIAPDVMARQVGDEIVLLDLSSGTYFGLDPVGARVWTFLQQNASLSDIAQTLAQEYEVERSVLEQDIVHLLDDLLQKGLIRPI